MSEIVTFRLAVKASSLARLWQSSFVEALTTLNLRLDQGPPGHCAVTSTDGNSLIWFDSGENAWGWLSRHDGLMSLWGSGNIAMGVSVSRELIPELDTDLQAEVGISLDLPSSGSADEQEALVSVAEALACAVLDECEVVRGLAYDERIFEQLNGVLPAKDGYPSGLPQWFGYWNAFCLDAYSDELRSNAERLAGVIEMRRSSFVIRLAKWPWEARIDELIELGRTLFPTTRACQPNVSPPRKDH